MTAFDSGLVDGACWLELADGNRITLPASRWTGRSTPADAPLLTPCDGPTLDVGCGPGRLTAALTDRGVPALGIDISATAVALTRARGAAALRRDIFDRLPGEGRWRQVLLADGNVGIGGDPARLLRRTRQLVRDDGVVLVETDAPGTGWRRSRVRVCGAGPWLDWAWLGADAAGAAAGAAGLRVRRAREHDGRWFCELVPA